LIIILPTVRPTRRVLLLLLCFESVREKYFILRLVVDLDAIVPATTNGYRNAHTPLHNRICFVLLYLPVQAFHYIKIRVFAYNVVVSGRLNNISRGRVFASRLSSIRSSQYGRIRKLEKLIYLFFCLPSVYKYHCDVTYKSLIYTCDRGRYETSIIIILTWYPREMVRF